MWCCSGDRTQGSQLGYSDIIFEVPDGRVSVSEVVPKWRSWKRVLRYLCHYAPFGHEIEEALKKNPPVGLCHSRNSPTPLKHIYFLLNMRAGVLSKHYNGWKVEVMIPAIYHCCHEASVWLNARPSSVSLIQTIRLTHAAHSTISRQYARPVGPASSRSLFKL